MQQSRTAKLLLRIGLASVFLYAAASATIHPNNWIGYLPSLLDSFGSREVWLKVFSLLQVGLGLWLLSGWRTKDAAWATMLMTAGIILANLHVFDVTFRDITIFFAAWALAVLES
ncbi:MAG TPA: DoxX family membrane protein [Candidatus Saccharimonadales bacterium]|nr:DoxX family membrane protein [Candidatus Saccharimonadales bacterium]